MTHLEALQTVPHFSHTFVADGGRYATSFDEHSVPGTSSDELPLNTRTISVGAGAVALAFSRRGYWSAPFCIHLILLRTETTRGRRTAAAVGITITIPIFIFLVAIGASIAELKRISMSVFCRRSKARREQCKKGSKGISGLVHGDGQTIDVGRNAHGGRTRLAREIVDGAHRPP